MWGFFLGGGRGFLLISIQRIKEIGDGMTVCLSLYSASSNSNNFNYKRLMHAKLSVFNKCHVNVIANLL